MLKQIFKVIGYSLLTLVGLSVVLYFLLTSYVNDQLEQRTSHQAYDSCHKVWSARGLYNKKRDQGPADGVIENSIESVALAFAKGGSGVEIDVRYDT
ncbi:MAG: hypothetical protein OQK78_12755, partial [Gammaproteobacteria bacterium]|nr:hypothetical protein [Gammaproteobacteria bacterium]